MSNKNAFVTRLLNLTDPEDHELRICGFPGTTSASRANKPADNATMLSAPIYSYSFAPNGGIKPVETERAEEALIAVRSYGPNIIRITAAMPGHEGLASPLESPMLSFAKDIEASPLHTERVHADDLDGEILAVSDDTGTSRLSFRTQLPTTDHWSDLLPGAKAFLDAIIPLRDRSPLRIDGFDQFFPAFRQSVGMGFVAKDGKTIKSTVSFQAEYNERFCGSGERFAPIDLSGRTFRLVNEDALGVSSHRAYKNVPFFLSSRGYGIFVHTSYPVTVSFKDTSSRSLTIAVDDDLLDIFILTAGTPAEILRDYRRLTGFPPEVPVWSYGTWMSRMTYFSADEIEDITRRLRSESYPCDVIHIDTGWFDKDWVCEWRFSKERFPDPGAFMRRLRDDGYRVSLWQNPNLGKENRLLPEALEKGYVPRPRGDVDASASDFAAAITSGQIDFSNPEATAWYRGLLRNLFDMGTAVIKTDFGEEIRGDVDYHAMSADELRNLYGLLYQKAAFEETEAATGEPIIWARAGWAGCQRYPVHWGGDAAATWEGLAASLRGGIHIGLSGFGHWSHDVPGFHGIPDFMNTRPDPLLYLRWTQFGVLSSHLRYHGTHPREPWHYPETADLVREWLELRYALIPYLRKSAREVSSTGYPMLRALIFHFPDDPMCWTVDDQYLLGADLLVAPVMSPEGIRDVYLPEGGWIDFFTGASYRGPRLLRGIESPKARIPLFVRSGATMPVYPEPVQHTGEMDDAKIAEFAFDSSYRGLAGTVLGRFIEL